MLCKTCSVTGSCSDSDLPSHSDVSLGAQQVPQHHDQTGRGPSQHSEPHSVLRQLLPTRKKWPNQHLKN